MNKCKKTFEYIYILLFILCLFSGKTFLYDLVMPILSIMVILLYILRIFKDFPKISFINKKNILCYFLFIIILIFLIMSIFISYSKREAIVMFLRLSVFSFNLLFITNMDLNFKIIKCCRFYSFFVMLSIILDKVLLGTNSGGLVGDHQFAGMISSISYCIFLVDFYMSKKDREITNILGVILSFIALLTTGKRAFTLICLGMLLLSFFIIKTEKKTSKFVVLTICLFASTLISNYFLPETREVQTRMIQYKTDNSFNGRTSYWTVSLDIFKKNKLFGIGIGNFAVYFDTFYHKFGNLNPSSAHNIYLQLLAEVGLFGFLLFIIFFIYNLYIIIKLLISISKKEISNTIIKYLTYISFVLQVWFLIYGLSGNPLYVCSQTLVYFFAVTIMLSIKDRIGCNE